MNTSPIGKLHYQKMIHSEMAFLDADQASQLLIAAKGSRYEAIYYLAIHTGMRQGELLGLKWSDLDWDRETVHVQRQIKRVPGQGMVFGSPKTKSGIRTIKIGSGILKSLLDHKDRQLLEKMAAGENWTDHDLIFPTSVGTPEHQSTLRKDFLRVLKRSGLPEIRFHDLRHTAATLLLNNNIPVIVVSKRLGHAKTSITLDTYGHLIHSMQDEAAKVMDQLVTPVEIALEEFDMQQIEVGDNRK
jgi:integrase